MKMHWCVLSGDGDEYWELETALELMRSRTVRSDTNADGASILSTSFVTHTNITSNVFLFNQILPLHSCLSTA